MNYETISFIVTLLSFTFLTIFSYIFTSTQSYAFFNKNEKRFGLAAIGCELLLAVMAVIDISGIAYTGGYTKLPVFCTVFGLIILLSLRLKNRLPEKFSQAFRFIVRSVMVCAFLEFFVFNFNSAHLFAGSYNTMKLPLDAAAAENFDANTGQNMDSSYFSLEFRNINIPVGTITIAADSNTNEKVGVNIDMSDDSNAQYRTSVAFAEVIRSNDKSRTIPCNFSGNVHDLKFCFYPEQEEVITVKSIDLNTPIYFNFSFIRFFIILFSSLTIYMLMLSPVFMKPLGENKRTTHICAYILTGIMIGTSLFITNIGRTSESDYSLKKDFTLDHGNQITQEIVDSFEAGQVSLLKDVPSDLLSLENPYDWSQRTAAGTDYLWDHLLYNGKYYSYYGIAPVVLLFLPYHLITKNYFPSVWAVWLFSALGIFFLSKLYLSFMDKFFSKIRSSLILSGLFIMQLISGIWFCLVTPTFYEIAQSSGFVCVTAGAFLLISSNVIGDGKVKNWRLALSTVLLSLAVLCRPTLAVYCVAALLFIYAGFRKKKLLYIRNISSARYYAPYFICALVPFAVIGGAQMLYNYARFGSVFDFGIQYSLTINDFTTAQYHTYFVLIGFFNYLFAIPSFMASFPFINDSEVQTFYPNGYYFIATAAAAGLVWKAFPLISYKYGLRAYRITKNPNKRLYTLLLVSVCIVAPFIIIFSIWESGYGARYCVDFAWQLLLGALVVSFIIYGKCSDILKKHLNRLMIISAVISFIIVFAQTYNWLAGSGISSDSKAMLLSFARLFEFWR